MLFSVGGYKKMCGYMVVLFTNGSRVVPLGNINSFCKRFKIEDVMQIQGASVQIHGDDLWKISVVFKNIGLDTRYCADTEVIFF